MATFRRAQRTLFGALACVTICVLIIMGVGTQLVINDVVEDEGRRFIGNRVIDRAE